MTDKKLDPFSPEFSTQTSYPYFNPKNIGDACRGYLVSTHERTDMHNEALQQKVYVIEVPEGESYKATKKVTDPEVTVKAGELMSIYGRFTNDANPDTKAIDEFQKVALGQMIGVKYDKNRTNKNGKEYKNWNTFVYPDIKAGSEPVEEPTSTPDPKADLPF